MTPAARIQAAIEILTALGQTAQPVDRFVRDWFRPRRYAGSKDRAAVIERIYDVFRHRASYAWRIGSEAPRTLVIASLLRESANVGALFDGSAYGPPPLTANERNAIAAIPAAAPPLWVLGEFPEWLQDELARSLGDALLPEMQAMLSRAPVDIRVNCVVANPDEVLRELTSRGFQCAVTAFAPNGIRLDSAVGLNA